ncbi:MAG: competence protein CoiA family protein [Bacteroidota bacterium]
MKPNNDTPIALNEVMKFAKDKATDNIVHVEEVVRGKKCNCVCLKCNENLIAKKGQIYTHFFAHESNSDCQGSQETDLHKYAKQVIVDNTQITIPQHGIITYSNPIAEKKLDENNLKPDVIADYLTQELLFEVLVTSPVSDKKEKDYQENERKSIEIDLRKIDVSTPETIKEAILNDPLNKRIIFWTPLLKEDVKEDNSILWAVGLFIVGLITFGGGRVEVTNPRQCCEKAVCKCSGAISPESNDDIDCT